MRPLDPHPASADLAMAGAADVAADIASGKTTSVEVTRRLLDRIAAVDQAGVRTNAVLAVAADALEVAAVLDNELAAGRRRGALHGVPVLIKDNIQAIGLPGTAGSLALVGRVVTRDATIVANLRDAGLVVLGSTNLSEWANIRSSRSTSGWSAVGGLTANPWALDRNAGGSSSGSAAAVAGGFAPLAIGTETDGSITQPSSLNGCVGLKPTVGLLSTAGIVPISHSQDAPGPMARSVRDVALLLDVLSGGTAYAAACGDAVDLTGVRLGVARRWYTGHALTDATFEVTIGALSASGVSLGSSKVPAPTDIVNDELSVLLAELHDDLGAYLNARPGVGPRSLADVVEFNRAHADTELIHFGQELFERAVASGGTGSDSYRQARRRCVEWAIDECLAPAFADDHAPEFLVAPISAPASKSDLILGDRGISGPGTHAPSIAGWPVLSLPMGLVKGMPVGMMLIGRPNSEARMLAVSHGLEQAMGLRTSGALNPTWSTPGRG